MGAVLVVPEEPGGPLGVTRQALWGCSFLPCLSAFSMPPDLPSYIRLSAGGW